MILQHPIKHLTILLLSAVLAAGMTGCGKKPVNLEAPNDISVSTYPQSYPSSEDVPGKGPQFRDLPAEEPEQ